MCLQQQACNAMHWYIPSHFYPGFCRRLHTKASLSASLARLPRFYLNDDMFNRTKEINRLSQVLLSTPQLSIVTGPVNSGKTMLLEKVLEDLPNKSLKPTPVYSINLRKGTFHSVRSLVASLSQGMNSWVNSIRTIMGNTAVSVTTPAVKFRLEPSGHTDDGYPIDHLSDLLEDVANAIPPSTLLRGSQQPVLFIDEANRLRTILRDKDGQAALESLFEWLIMHTKEKRHFHVVLASSDSFFNLWVERFIGPSRYSTYVLGHLDPTEAKRYWQGLLSDNEKLLQNMATPKFDDVFSVCGGSMFLMNVFMKEWCEEKGSGMIGSDVKKFSMVLQEQRRLMSALSQARNFEEIDPPKWTRANLIGIMEMVCHNKGIVDYETLCSKFGKETINSVIEYNVMHLRPTCTLSFDVEAHEEPIVTPESPASKAAMERILLNTTAS